MMEIAPKEGLVLKTVIVKNKEINRKGMVGSLCIFLSILAILFVTLRNPAELSASEHNAMLIFSCISMLMGLALIPAEWT